MYLRRPTRDAGGSAVVRAEIANLALAFGTDGILLAHSHVRISPVWRWLTSASARIISGTPKKWSGTRP